MVLFVIEITTSCSFLIYSEDESFHFPNPFGCGFEVIWWSGLNVRQEWNFALSPKKYNQRVEEVKKMFYRRVRN